MSEETGWLSRAFLDRNFKVAATFAALLLAIGAATYWKAPELIQHLTVTVTAMVGVHLLERIWLWREVVDQFSAHAGQLVRDANELVSGASQVGLVRIYPNRGVAAAEILGAIKGARERIWLLGVALTARVPFDAIVDDLVRVVRSTGNVRLLALDPLRSPAVFRTLLESRNENAVKQVLFDGEADKSKLSRQTIGLAELIKDNYPDLETCIKFYAHNPNCWLVFVDDTVFFEPYTLASAPGRGQTDKCIGQHMPVLKLRLQDGGVFHLLVSHFHNVWDTSDSDLFHFSAHAEDAKRILNKVLENRKAWFEHVFGSLSHRTETGNDRRSHPRQAPASFAGAAASPISVNMVWRDGQSGDHNQRVEVRNLSRRGMSVFLNSEKGPQADATVWVSRTTGPPTRIWQMSAS